MFKAIFQYYMHLKAISNYFLNFPQHLIEIATMMDLFDTFTLNTTVLWPVLQNI